MDASHVARGFESLSTIAYEVQCSNYVYVASTAFFVYDYLTTLDIETELVWPAEWTPLKVLFLLNRYSPFLDVAFLTRHRLFLNNSASTCQRLAELTSWLFVSGTCISEAILTVRTWVIWEKKRSVAVILCPVFIGSWVGMSVLVWNALHDLESWNLPYIGCVMSRLSRDVSFAYGILATFDLGLLLAIVAKSILVRCDPFSGQSSLAKVMYRDGIAYYALLAGLSICNLIIVMTLPVDYQPILILFERVMVSSLTSHVIFNIRLEVSTKLGSRTRSPTLTLG